MLTLTMRLLRVVVLTALVGGSLATSIGRAAAQELDGDTYTDEGYGWSVTFDDTVWTGDTVDGSGSRGLSLVVGNSGYALLTVLDDGETDPAACLETRQATFEANDLISDVAPARRLDAPKTSRDAEATLLTAVLTQDDGDVLDVVEYLECREVDGGTLGVEVFLVVDAYEDLVPDVEDLVGAIEVDTGSSTRDETPTPRDEDTPTPEDQETPTPQDEETPVRGGADIADGLDGDTFGDADHGWQVQFDDRVWTAEEAQSDRGASLDYRGVSLSTDGGVATLLVYDDGIEDAADCLADLDRSYAASDGWDGLAPARRLDPPATDRDAETELYTGTLLLDSGDVDAVLYLECREVEGATLAITITVAADTYEDLLPDIEDLLAGVDTAGGSSSADEKTPTPEDEETPAANKRRTPTPDGETPESGGNADNDLEAGELDTDTFTDTTLGYTVTWDDRIWAAEAIDGGTTAGFFLTTVDDNPYFATFTIDGSNGYAGSDPEQCVSDLAAGIEDFEGYSALVEESRVDGPTPPRDGAGAVYSFTFTADNGDEFEQVVYIECRPIDDESMVRVSLYTDQDTLEAEVADAEEVLDSIEIDGGSGGDTNTDDPLGPADETPTTDAQEA